MSLPFKDLPFDLKEEVSEWRELYGRKETSKIGSTIYIIDYKHGNRMNLFIILIEKLKELGAGKDFFLKKSVRDAIIEPCLRPKKLMGKSKYSGAVKLAGEDLNTAIRKVFGTESDFFKQNGTKRIVKDLNSTEESNIVSLEEQAIVEEKEIIASQIHEPLVAKEPPPPIKEYDGAGKEDVIPKETIVDEEMAKEMAEFLGSNDE